MRGLSDEIKTALDITIEGLQYKIDISQVDEDKMKKTMDSKVSSFLSAKKLIKKWIESANAPTDATLKKYVRQVIKAGDEAIKSLRVALSTKINFEELDAAKHDSAIKAKPIILEAIFELDDALRELREQLENDKLSFEERSFRLGFPERFAKGEFLDRDKLWREPLDKDGAVIICPHGTKGEKIVLDNLEIWLPKPPKDRTQILFHDKPKADQYWVRPTPPEFSPENEDKYADFIKEEFRRRVEGIWFYNNGKAVYLTGHMYFTLTYVRMMDNGGFMEFRYAQLNMFYHSEACIRDPRCLGQIFLKSRRTGFSQEIIGIQLNNATMNRNHKYGNISKTNDDGQEVFYKISYAFQSLPFYFRPVVQGKIDSPSHLLFSAPADSSRAGKKANLGNVNDYLNTMIDFRACKNSSYDSIKLNGYLLDECGKWEKPNNVIAHLAIVSPTLMPNSGRVIGTLFAGSTVGKHSSGGAEFIELIKASNVLERDPKTQKTTTALYSYFLPAQDNIQDFTDVYGVCHTVKPTKKTYNVFGEEITMGSIDFLIAVEEQKKKQSDMALNEFIRTYPRTMEHAMRDEAGDCQFNLVKLIDQIDYNDGLSESERYTVGNFEWLDSEDGDVMFSPNPRGRFKVAWLPSKADGTEGLANRVQQIGDRFYPMNKDCVRFGCDPFSIKATVGTGGSKGAIHGKTIMLPEGGAPSNQFVLEYIARPSDEMIFFEDVIKCIRYYGAPILVESNRIDLLRHMWSRGYRPFAMNRLDKTKLGENEEKYGGQTMSGESIIDSHKNALGAWIERYVGYSTNPEIREEGEMGVMPFNETLSDWSKFVPYGKERTKYDASISSGLAIMACQTEKYKGKQKKPTPKIINFVKKYNNSGSIGTLINK